MSAPQPQTAGSGVQAGLAATATASTAGPPGKARVVIIGGGIIGASVAFHLTERGVRDVVLLERHTLTSGTTWHAAGLVAQLRATHNMTRLAAYTAELYERLEHEENLPTGFVRTGSITIAENQERMEELRRQAAMARAFDVAVEEIDLDRAVQMWPHLNPEGLVGAVHLPLDAQTSPVDTTMALATMAKRGGARIFEGVDVRAIQSAGGRVSGVSTSHGEIEADVVVTCAGLWSHKLGRDAGVTIPLQACEHFYIVTEPVPDLGRHLPTLRNPDRHVYIKEDAGRILVGMFEPVAKPMIDPPTDRPFMQLDEDWDHLGPHFERAIERLPILGEVGLRLFFNGPESFTPDDRYLLGETPGLRQHFVATGFNSIGIQSAGGAGKVLADWIVDGHPPMDLWDVDVRRAMPFQANQRYLRDRSVEALGLLYEMHWPFRQPATARGVRRTPIHERLADRGAGWGEAAGWERANWFIPGAKNPQYEYSFGRQNWFEYSAAEHRATRETVALFDQSSFAKFLVQGPDAEALLQHVSTNDIAGPPGTTTYTQWCNERGGIEADLTVSRVDADSWMVVTGVGTQTRDLDWLRRQREAIDATVSLTDVTSAWAVLGVMGPNSRALLSEVTNADLSDEAFPFSTAREIDLGYALARAMRLSYVGELGWELYLPSEFAVGAFDAIAAVGEQHGLVMAGMHAMNSLRIESGFRHWGHDITDEDTPLQAGLSFAVAWDKPGGFIGRDALLAGKTAGLSRRLVQFQLEDPEPLLFHDEPIWRDGKIVGHTTSAMYGHTVGASVAMGYVRQEPGTPVPELLDADFAIEVAGTAYAATAQLKALRASAARG